MALSRPSLERLIEASPDIVVATDLDGNVSYYNDGAQESLGYQRDEIIGRPVTRIYPSPEEARRVMAAMRDPALLEKGRVSNFATRFVAKDGREIPVAISGVVLYGDDGDEQGTIGFAKDLTEIIRRDQLALLGEIAVGLSHEINNPLEVIANQVALLERFVKSHASPAEFSLESQHLESVRCEIGRIEAQLRRLGEMAEHDEYTSTRYLGNARMVDLSGNSRGEGTLVGRRILVVDDDAAVRESVAEILSAAGSEVVAAASGAAGLDRLEERLVDLVLSDVVMPDMDGYEFYQETKRRYPGTPIALMTAFYYDREHVIKRSRVQGLEAVLFKKPIDPARLQETLARLVTPPRPAPSSR
jgi:PAS domain S-box-containing protein